MVEKHSEKYQQICKAILQRCNEKEKLGVKNLYDSDIYDIQTILKNQHIKVSYQDVSDTLDMLLNWE